MTTPSVEVSDSAPSPEPSNGDTGRKSTPRTRKTAASRKSKQGLDPNSWSWIAPYWKQIAALVALSVLLSVALSVALTAALLNNSSETTASVGGALAPGEPAAQPVASTTLTEPELKEFLGSAGIPAYWAGGEANARYVANVGSNRDVLISYVPEGTEEGEIFGRTLMIATYPMADAYALLEAATQEPNAISSINEDGALIYYTSDRPSNVYLAYPGQPFQIEVFDPNSVRALEIATEPGRIQPVN